MPKNIVEKRFKVRNTLEIIDEETGRAELSIPVEWGDMPFDAKHFVVEMALHNVFGLARKLQDAGIRTAVQRGFPQERIDEMLKQLEVSTGEVPPLPPRPDAPQRPTPPTPQPR